jgi:hypothetical protein
MVCWRKSTRDGFTLDLLAFMVDEVPGGTCWLVGWRLKMPVICSFGYRVHGHLNLQV